MERVGLSRADWDCHDPCHQRPSPRVGGGRDGAFPLPRTPRGLGWPWAMPSSALRQSPLLRLLGEEAQFQPRKHSGCLLAEKVHLPPQTLRGVRTGQPPR